MAISYTCPNCRKYLGSDTDVINPVCPACGTRFDPENLRKNRRRDRWMHILVLSLCSGIGGGAAVMIAVTRLSPDNPRMGAFLFAGFLIGIIGGFFGLKAYDARRNGPM